MQGLQRCFRACKFIRASTPRSQDILTLLARAAAACLLGVLTGVDQK